jgi:uncharacterized damage-inducible protein DinB
MPEPVHVAQNTVQTLVRYKAWADSIILPVFAMLPETELVAPRLIHFGSIIRTLDHSRLMDLAWQSHLLGKPHGLATRNPVEHPSIGELIASQHAIDAWFVDHADSLSCNQLREMVDFEFIGGGAGAMSRAEIFLHVVNHATYHRGQATGMLYHLGIFPPATDLPVFLRGGGDRPACAAGRSVA